jgi:hypothetical protein
MENIEADRFPRQNQLKPEMEVKAEPARNKLLCAIDRERREIGKPKKPA